METSSVLTTAAPVASTLRLALCFDTETTGLPLWKEPSEDERQPHIVELAAKLVNLDTRVVVDQMCVLIKPDGWSWDDSSTSEDVAFKTHGISMERAMDEGIPETQALEQLMSLWSGSLLIAHNESFDRRMVRIGLKRHLDPLTPEGDIHVSEKWKAATSFCTCWKSRPIVKMPGNKLPKLTEAYQHFLGMPMQGAHTAMGDVNGCLAVYWAIQDLLNPPAAAAPQPQAA